MHSPESLRQVIDSAAYDLQERGAFRDVVVHGNVYSTLSALRAFCRSAPTTALENVLQQLNAAEDAALDAERCQAALEERDADEARRVAPFTAAEERERQRTLDEARETAEHQSSVEARLGRIEDLLERIATGLERR
jgi:hypothetical protein